MNKQAYIVVARSPRDPKFTLKEIISVFSSEQKAFEWIVRFPKEEAEQYHVQIWDIK